MLAARRPLNIYRMVAHGGAVGEGFLALGGAILRKSTIDPGLRELVILRVGALCASGYEVFQHRRAAARVGVPAGKIEMVLADPGSPVAADVFSAAEVDVLAFTDAVVGQVKAPQQLFDRVAARLAHGELVELLMTIGFYMLVSRFLENLEVDIEEPAV